MQLEALQEERRFASSVAVVVAAAVAIATMIVRRKMPELRAKTHARAREPQQIHQLLMSILRASERCVDGWYEPPMQQRRYRRETHARSLLAAST